MVRTISMLGIHIRRRIPLYKQVRDGSQVPEVYHHTVVSFKFEPLKMKNNFHYFKNYFKNNFCCFFGSSSQLRIRQGNFSRCDAH